MKKATRKILSLALVVFMLLSTFAMMFANAEAAAETPVTTPKDYATAADGEKLLDVDFNKHWTVIDDTKMSYDNNGVTYSDAGLEVTPDPANNKDVDGNGKFEGYGVDVVAFLNGWNKVNTDPTGAGIIEDEGASLTVRGAIDAIGTEGEAGYVPAVPSDATANDQRLIGTLPYDLENSTYTMKFDANWNNARFKFYFANGTFMNFGGMDHFMPCLGLELKTSGYRLMRQSSAITTGVVGTPTVTTVDKVNSTTFKVVLKGGEKIEDVTLYDGSWLNAQDGVGKWVGDVIPVEFTLYNSVTADDGSVQDLRICTGTIYQPADVNLVFGIGEYTAPSKNQFYSLTNLDVYKGDTSVPYNFNFTKIYSDANWGDEITIFDARGITKPAYNMANGYQWTHQGSVTVDEEGVVTINRTDKGAAQGANTTHPFGAEWNQGYYEMEFTLNNMNRFKFGLFNLIEPTTGGIVLERAGFAMIPNIAAADALVNSQDQYITTGRANVYFGAANSFSFSSEFIDQIKYDTYVADEANVPNPEFDATKEESEENPKFIKDGIPEDPRLVRDYGGNRANVKITYDCEHYIITLYEKCGSEWCAISAIDYSKAVEAGYILEPVLDFYAYDANSNVTLKNFRVKKGMSVTELHTYAIGSLETDIYSTFDAEAGAQLEEAFAEYYGLTNYEFGFTNDGVNFVEDYKALYDEIVDENTYGINAIKLAPIVKYEELATSPVVRGVQVSLAEDDASYDVRFISAIGDITGIAKIGYEIEKTVSVGLYSKTTSTSVETDKVVAQFNANGLYYAASSIGGEYAVAAGLKDEAVVEGAIVSYSVTVYTIAQDGTKTVLDGTTTFTLVEGNYAVYGW